MIDSDFVAEIKRLAEAGVKPEIIDADEGYRLVMVGGVVVHTFQKDAPFGPLQVADFASFNAACGRLIQEAETAVIKVSECGAILLCDEAKPHKKAWVTLNFKLTSAFDCLCSWVAGPKNVSSINKLLRTKLVGTFDEKLLPIFKQVEFARAGSTTIAKDRNRDTMGKTVDNAVKSAAGEIPEVLLFQTQIFQNVPCEVSLLRYFVDVNHDNETIGIAAMGDVVERAIADTVLMIVERLAKDWPDALVVAS